MPSVRQPGCDPSCEIMNADKPFAVLKLIGRKCDVPAVRVQGMAPNAHR